MGDLKYCYLRVVTDGKEYNYDVSSFADIAKISKSDWVKRTTTVDIRGFGSRFIGKTLNLEINLYPENGRYNFNIVGNSIDYPNDIVEFTVRNDIQRSPFSSSELDKDLVATLIGGYGDATDNYYRFNNKEVSEMITPIFDCRRYDIVADAKDKKKEFWVYYIVPTTYRELPSLMGFSYNNRSL